MKRKLKPKHVRPRDNRLYTLEVFFLNAPVTEEFFRQNPVVARTIEIRGDQTLEDLHRAIFDAFDREEEHMYEFQFGKRFHDPKNTRYVLPGAFGSPFEEPKPARKVTDTTVGSLGLEAGQAFGYWFDFGDDWLHQINVIAVEDQAPSGKYPRVTDRVGASPPQYADWDEDGGDEQEEGAEEEHDYGGDDGEKETDPFVTQVPARVADIVKLPRIADPTIDQVLQQFLDEQRGQLKAGTVAKYEEVLDLLRHHLNGYAYEGLSKAESALFDKHFDAQGEEHREFCQIFGPDKVVENLGGFVGYFMVRKVMGSANLKRAAGTVTKKLSEWLAKAGHISDDEAHDGAERGAEAARDLPLAERAAAIPAQALSRIAVDPNELEDKDYFEFDHYTIAKIEPGRLWFTVFDDRGETTEGPIPVPKEATSSLREGWEISCALGRIRGKWRLVEVANVYPG